MMVEPPPESGSVPERTRDRHTAFDRDTAPPPRSTGSAGATSIGTTGERVIPGAVHDDDRQPVGEYTGFDAEQFLQRTAAEVYDETRYTPEARQIIEQQATRDDMRRTAIHAQRQHDPAFQQNGYNRCEHCHYTRHPCEVYDLATMVLFLLDEGRDGRMESDAD